MTEFAPFQGLIGGVLIGIAAVLMMLLGGRIAGVSGIISGAMFARDWSSISWRLAFIAGLPLGVLVMVAVGLKDLNALSFPAALPATIAAGFIVGVGTVMGSGCTSGHGICGLARFSMRSLVATAVFMISAAATVFVVRHVI